MLLFSLHGALAATPNSQSDLLHSHRRLPATGLHHAFVLEVRAVNFRAHLSTTHPRLRRDTASGVRVCPHITGDAPPRHGGEAASSSASVVEAKRLRDR